MSPAIWTKWPAPCCARRRTSVPCRTSRAGARCGTTGSARNGWRRFGAWCTSSGRKARYRKAANSPRWRSSAALARIFGGGSFLCGYDALRWGLSAPGPPGRAARYFYRHTLVAGRPLEFTGRPRPMLLIFVLLLLLAYGAMASLSTLIYLIYERGELALYGMAEGATFSAYDITGTFGQNLAVASFVLAGAALAPFFWGHAVRFRLGATVWRGLHLQFAAGWREVYRASRPLR